ncbi:MAG: hypothetical protein M1817_000127 [Caeruleum heppii]|nr:MAG: hypothetical protein M1817_000127 [Caeruleum heppii]
MSPASVGQTLPLVCHMRPRLACSAPARLFSSTPSILQVGPESPKYIQIPKPRQPSTPTERRLRGILPTPREIFPRRARDKVSPEYLDSVTPEPSIKASSQAPSNDHSMYKSRMAETRRRNLREGLLELHARKQQKDGFVAARSKRRHAEREKLLAQDTQEDERLTTPSIVQSMKELQRGPVPDPDRARRIAEKVARVQGKATERENQRRDALHSLYVQAKNFITTEEKWNEEVERVFNDDTGSTLTGDPAERSIWSRGAPDSISDLLNVDTKSTRSAARAEAYQRLNEERVGRIGDELTRGQA